MKLREWCMVFITALAMVFPSCGDATQGTAQPSEPITVVHIGPVAPDIIGVTIKAGRVEHGQQVPYQKEKTDVVQKDNLDIAWVLRGGKRIGALVGDGSLIYTADRLVGEKLDTDLADRPETYTLKSAEDPGMVNGASPKAVFRKSKPTDLARGAGFEASLQHIVYLKLAAPLKAGKKYTLAFKSIGIPEQSFTYDRSASPRSKSRC